MCIRDRTRVDRLAENPYPLLAWRSLSAVESAVLLRVFEGCLLYTSDAADERSSVDLGGRRIIKKKKGGQVSGGGVHHYTRNQREQSRQAIT